MGGLSFWHILLVLAVLLLLFGGKGKLSGLMGDLAKGIKAFKTGMKDEDVAEGPVPPQVAPPGATAAVGGSTDRVHDRS
jgi:sec-independent protein translocase protein TatA